MTEDLHGAAAAAIPSALGRFDLLRQRMGGRRPAIFLDFDGTLTPIVAHPDLAVLPAPVRSVIAGLAQALPVAVISGRDREDVEAKVGIAGLVYAGSHGFDIRVPERGRLEPAVGADCGPVLDRAARRLHARLDGVPGALIERKRFSLAAHWRQVAAADAHVVADAVAEVAAELPELKVKRGKMVLELQPAVDWDKGKAVLWLLAELGLDRPEVVPLFVGDDVTDEDAFRALRGRGIGIVVAEPHDHGRRTHAEFRLDDVDQVIELLRRLNPEG